MSSLAHSAQGSLQPPTQGCAGRPRPSLSAGLGSGLHTRRRFTLLEILIVVAIIAVLSGLGLHAMRSAIERAAVARAGAQLEAIRAALGMYKADLRAAPRSQQGTTPDELLKDHGHYLYAALMNRPTLELGGGPNPPYLKGSEVGIGVITDRDVLNAAPMGSDGNTAVRALNLEEQSRSTLPEFQKEHSPSSAEPFVFLDPWGNPWHCRIWTGVRLTSQQAIVNAPPARSGFESAPYVSGSAPISGPVYDKPHVLGGIEMWSNGPNGVNEYGSGDDVKSW